MKTFVARVAGTLAAILAVLVSVIGGLITPGHSHTANYISELGARGAPYGEQVSVAGFLPIGLASLIALVASARLEANRRLQASVVWMLTVPIAYIVAAFARCGPGCAGIDASQAAHNLAGVAEYLGGAIALGTAGVALVRVGRGVAGAVCWVLCGIVLVCLYGIGLPLSEYRGAAQRVAEIVLFGFILYLAWHQPQVARIDRKHEH
jgi:hypothetical membrane protein